MIRSEAVEGLKRMLFATREEMVERQVPERVQARVLRLREMYARWLENPQWGDRDVVRVLRKEHGIGQSMAYEDVYVLKRCLGALNQLSRDWAQHLFMTRLEEAFRMAQEAGDAKAYIAALNALGRFARLDKDELRAPDYADVQPVNIEATTTWVSEERNDEGGALPGDGANAPLPLPEG